MFDIICEILKSIDISVDRRENFAIAFSGGLDSSLLAKIVKDNFKDVTLLSIGFPGSHDIEFSKFISNKMSIKHITYEINIENFIIVLKKIIKNMPCNNLSHIENCVAFYYISFLASSNGFNNVLTANGFDELFCGYNRYRQIFSDGIVEINKFMDKKIENEQMLVKEIQEVSNEFNVSIKQPFLSCDFIEYAKKIPIDKKITSSNDLLRKHILREVAILLNVPVEAALQPKKALQYGSLIHKNLIKGIKKEDEIRKLLLTKINH